MAHPSPESFSNISFNLKHILQAKITLIFSVCLNILCLVLLEQIFFSSFDFISNEIISYGAKIRFFFLKTKFSYTLIIRLRYFLLIKRNLPCNKLFLYTLSTKGLEKVHKYLKLCVHRNGRTSVKLNKHEIQYYTLKCIVFEHNNIIATHVQHNSSAYHHPLNNKFPLNTVKDTNEYMFVIFQSLY